eukprot:jgi/Mesvir1/28575/Mv00990-RA.1
MERIPTTIVEDRGEYGSSCGYCKSGSSSSYAYGNLASVYGGMWCHAIAVADYQALLDRGWRRSGCYLYKPDLPRTCCRLYTIRLHTASFAMSRAQHKVLRRMEGYLAGTWVPSPSALGRRPGGSHSNKLEQGGRGGGAEGAVMVAVRGVPAVWAATNAAGTGMRRTRPTARIVGPKRAPREAMVAVQAVRGSAQILKAVHRWTWRRGGRGMPPNAAKGRHRALEPDASPSPVEAVQRLLLSALHSLVEDGSFALPCHPRCPCRPGGPQERKPAVGGNDECIPCHMAPSDAPSAAHTDTNKAASARPPIHARSGYGDTVKMDATGDHVGAGTGKGMAKGVSGKGEKPQRRGKAETDDSSGCPRCQLAAPRMLPIPAKLRSAVGRDAQLMTSWPFAVAAALAHRGVPRRPNARVDPLHLKGYRKGQFSRTGGRDAPCLSGQRHCDAGGGEGTRGGTQRGRPRKGHCACGGCMHARRFRAQARPGDRWEVGGRRPLQCGCCCKHGHGSVCQHHTRGERPRAEAAARGDTCPRMPPCPRCNWAARSGVGRRRVGKATLGAPGGMFAGGTCERLAGIVNHLFDLVIELLSPALFAVAGAAESSISVLATTGTATTCLSAAIAGICTILSTNATGKRNVPNPKLCTILVSSGRHVPSHPRRRGKRRPPQHGAVRGGSGACGGRCSGGRGRRCVRGVDIADGSSGRAGGRMCSYGETAGPRHAHPVGHGGAPCGTGPAGAQLCKPPGRQPGVKHTLEISTHRAAFSREEFELYRRYQVAVHGDSPSKASERSYIRFLVDTPLDNGSDADGQGGPPAPAPSCGFGSFHQQYRIDGRLVAVGVVDILPHCLSSKYLFWDPDYAFLSLGKFTALKEIEWVRSQAAACPPLAYYYLGYYIHTCPKMRYKAAYAPAQLLCPEKYEWVPYEDVCGALDSQPYCVLSDVVANKGTAKQGVGEKGVDAAGDAMAQGAATGGSNTRGGSGGPRQGSSFVPGPSAGQEPERKDGERKVDVSRVALLIQGRLTNLEELRRRRLVREVLLRLEEQLTLMCRQVGPAVAQRLGVVLP